MSLTLDPYSSFQCSNCLNSKTTLVEKMEEKSPITIVGHLHPNKQIGELAEKIHAVCRYCFEESENNRHTFDLNQTNIFDRCFECRIKFSHELEAPDPSKVFRERITLNQHGMILNKKMQPGPDPRLERNRRFILQAEEAGIQTGGVIAAFAFGAVPGVIAATGGLIVHELGNNILGPGAARILKDGTLGLVVTAAICGVLVMRLTTDDRFNIFIIEPGAKIGKSLGRFTGQCLINAYQSLENLT